MSNNPYSESLSHTTWECKYHIVFAPKCRRKEIYGKLRQDIGMIMGLGDGTRGRPLKVQLLQLIMATYENGVEAILNNRKKK